MADINNYKEVNDQLYNFKSNYLRIITFYDKTYTAGFQSIPYCQKQTLNEKSEALVLVKPNFIPAIIKLNKKGDFNTKLLGRPVDLSQKDIIFVETPRFKCHQQVLLFTNNQWVRYKIIEVSDKMYSMITG